MRHYVTSKKREYCEKLNINSITDNRFSWKTACPLFSKKRLFKNSKIILLEKDEIVRDDAKTAEIFNTFFSDIIKSLKCIEKNESITYNTGTK